MRSANLATSHTNTLHRRTPIPYALFPRTIPHTLLLYMELGNFYGFPVVQAAFRLVSEGRSDAN